MNKRGLFLDLDGTVADSLDVMLKVYEKFLLLHGKQPSMAEFERLNGPPLREVVSQIVENHCIEGECDELYEYYQRILLEVYCQVRPMPGAIDLLTEAQTKGCKTTLVTSNTRALAESWLEHSGMRSLIDEVVAGEDVVNGKPSPEPYLCALKKTGCTKEDSIAVEDSIQGAQSALSAGMKVYGLGMQSWPTGVCPVSGLEEVTNALSLKNYPLNQNINFLIEGDVAELPHELEKEVENIWQSSSGLHDGKIISVNRVSDDTVSCSKSNYRRFHAQLSNPRLFSDHFIYPLAVTGLIVCRDGIVFALRSHRVSQDSGMWELAPAGGVDANKKRPNGQIDLSAQLAEEAREELGLDIETGKVSILGMIEDQSSGVFDVGLVIEVPLGADEIQAHFEMDAGDEYDEIRIVPSDQLNGFLATEKISTVSRRLACMYLYDINPD